MFGFGMSRSASAITFVVGNSALFSKKELSPVEFGREIARLGLKFGVAQFSQYEKATDLDRTDQALLQEARKNPGIIQLLYGNLVAGSFLCFAKAVLRAPPETILEVESGILAGLRGLMPGMSQKIIEDHKDITANFAVAVEREITEIEANSSLNLLLKYIVDFYPNMQLPNHIPGGFVSFINGLGSRFVAICLNDWKITLRRN